MEEERVFTPEEARGLLPRLRAILTELVEVSRRLADPERVRAARSHVGANGGATAGRELLSDSERLTRLVAEVRSLGVTVRDPSTGLVDFPAVREGRGVYLCWRLGEDDLGYWHERDSGFTGRRPL